MKLDHLRHRVARAEVVLEGRKEQVRTHWTTLQQGWHEGWTPLRIVVVGLGTGFLVGRAEPVAALGKLGGTHWLQMLSALYKLLNATMAKASSNAPERAADTTQAAADTAPHARPADSNATTRPNDPPDASGPDAPNPTDTATPLSEP